jgi:hypothetical protein
MDLLPTLIIALIGLVVGLLLGLLVSNLRGKPPTDRAIPTASESSPEGSVRLWHDRQALAVEIDGKTLRLPGSLSAEQRGRLVQLSGELADWLGITPSAAAVPPTPQPLKAEQPAPVPAPEAGGAAREPAGQSIAAQIDAILQQKLERSPLASKAIRLLELPGQGMVVMVGLDKYTDLTQVPDPEVRAVIAESVAEWEKRAGPKVSG